MVFAPQRYLFSSILPIPLFPYNQRKHVEKHRFPLVIGTFLCYIQRKHIKKHQFPLIIEIVLLINLPSWNQPKSQRIGIILLFKTIHHTKYAEIAIYCDFRCPIRRVGVLLQRNRNILGL